MRMPKEWMNILSGSSATLSQFMADEILTQTFTKVSNVYANQLFSAGVTGLNQQENICREKEYILSGQQK